MLKNCLVANCKLLKVVSLLWWISRQFLKHWTVLNSGVFSFESDAHTTVATVLVGGMSASDRLRQCAVQSVSVVAGGSSGYSSRAETGLKSERKRAGSGEQKTTGDFSFFRCLYLYFPLPEAIFHSRSLPLQSDVSIFLEPSNSNSTVDNCSWIPYIWRTGCLCACVCVHWTSEKEGKYPEALLRRHDRCWRCVAKRGQQDFEF